MEVSRKTDYAIRMLAELVNRSGEVVSVRSAAHSNKVPYSFARSIQHDLVESGIVESVRGSRGGMRLAVDPKTTTMLAVIEAVQGPVHVSACDSSGPNDGPCLFMKGCAFSALWCEAERMLRDYFRSVTLHQVAVEGRTPFPRKGHDFVALTAEERAAHEFADEGGG